MSKKSDGSWVTGVEVPLEVIESIDFALSDFLRVAVRFSRGSEAALVCHIHKNLTHDLQAMPAIHSP